MIPKLQLAPNSKWAGLAARFAGGDASLTLTDSDAVDGDRLLLHRRPRPDAGDEIGFYLESCDSGIVEIASGEATSRALVAAAWQAARDLGLEPLRLAVGEEPLASRFRELAIGTDAVEARAARLVTAAGAALERGATGPAELDRLLVEVWEGPGSALGALNRLDATRRARFLDDARRRAGLARLPAALRRDLAWGTKLAERRVVLTVDGRLARIRLVRPHRLNALDPEMLAELDVAWQEAEARDAVHAIVLEAAGPAFMAGVDLDRILAWMEADRFDEIEGFVRAAHRFLERVDASPRHTLVRLHGLAVGSGAEFCAAFDTIVATPQGSLGFPELSLGIYPAMGGTQRMPRRVGLPVARWWILASALLPAARAATLGMVDAVVDEKSLDSEILRCSEHSPTRPRASRRPRADRSRGPATLAGFGSASLAELRRPGSPAAVARVARTLARRPRQAVEIADRLLLGSAEWDLQRGLEEEIRHLGEVFPTAEALDGIRRALRGAARSPAD